MVVELTREDRSRLSALIHGYGSVAALERALGAGKVEPSPTLSSSQPVDLARMVRVEVAHQLGRAGHTTDRNAAHPDHGQATWLQTVSALPVADMRGLLSRISVVAVIALALIVLAGFSPLGASAAAIAALVGIELSSRRSPPIVSLVWRVAAACCVVAWAETAAWPAAISALVLGSVLSLSVADPVRAFVEKTDTP